MRKTKIIATMGPATSTYEIMVDLIKAGLDVARANFSHESHAEHERRINLMRKAAHSQGRTVAILQDLQGPKIRTGKLKDSQPINLVNGKQFTITTRDIIGSEEIVSTVYQKFASDVNPGDRVLLSDGLIELRVLQKAGEDVLCEVVNGGVLREKQGINLPGVRISAPSLTEKDIDDLLFGLKIKVDYIALSFVRSAKDIKQAKDLISKMGCDTPVIAKLERPEAIENLDEILDIADGVMVARGDLGVELPPEQVPLMQKEIIKRANQRSIPVITATQMLDSMIWNPRPSRPEISDVANAIIDGSDAVMLSGETASGKYPVQSVAMMCRIAEEVETNSEILEHNRMFHWEFAEVHSSPQAIGAAVSTIVRSLPVKAIWVHTMSGSTPRLISHYRPSVPIYAFTPSEIVCNRLNLLWGVRPIKIEFYRTYEDLEKQVFPLVKELGLAEKGDTVIMTGGHPTSECGPTNFLKIQTLDYLH